MSRIETFEHAAMKTVFSLRIGIEEERNPGPVVRACVERIDELESLLSRYREGSEVQQINRMRAGEFLFLSESTYDCVRAALSMYEASGGAFDVSIGRQIEHAKQNQEGSPPALRGALALDPERPAIHCIEEGREIDLGGIGKGFTLDSLKILLEEHGVGRGLLSAGSSTHLAFGSGEWPIHLNGRKIDRRWMLSSRALSASGIEIQGSHILTPGSFERGCKRDRVWVAAKSATVADALSTTAMILEDADLERIIRQVDPDGEVILDR